ncbi:MAG: hypothetical protein ACR2NZ_24565 [Rubripirellula sp.]
MWLRLATVGTVLFLMPLASVFSELSQLPVREVTVFKDGHAFVVRRGNMEVSTQGSVRLGNLPQPVMGTFWPFVDDTKAVLQSVTVGEQIIESRQSALTVEGFLRANVGKLVKFRYDGVLVEGRVTEIKLGSALVMIETTHGYRMVPMADIRNLEFVERPSQEWSIEQKQPVLEMQLQWTAEPQPSVSVGMSYLQRGIRWIPSYRVVLGDDGFADVRLQATLINELVDLENADVRLVVGVPSFLFKETQDPIGGAATLSAAQQGLSQYFDDGSQAARGFSNAMVTQVSRMGEHRNSMMGGRSAQGGSSVEPFPGDEDHQGEHHVFTLSKVTVRRGGRQVHQLGRWRVPAEEVYRLVVSAMPPAELRPYGNSEQANRLLEMMRSPKVHRLVRLTNTTDSPMTTAPALIIDGETGLVVAQSIMTYAAVGSQVDLEVTQAVDLQVSIVDQETERTANALRHNGDAFAQVDLSSSVTISNYRSKELNVEVVRELLGEVVKVSSDGVASTRPYGSHRYRPAWYWSYSWPAWWNQINPAVSVRWDLKLPPGRSGKVQVDWRYHWR